MEKIKVNMSPNPLDVQTIHASQNDNEAREWGFELHNNGDAIDSSEISDQLVFKAYKGGTEQILPENTSTPTTSPFKGDIKYPQGLLSDQEFTYRESPTEEDGLAKITDIKGNTLNWNQLVQNGNFADTSNWIKGRGASSLAISNNEAVITIGGEWNNDVRQYQGVSFISGHKYFASFEAKASVPISLALASINTTPTINFAILTNVLTTFRKIASIVTAQTNADSIRIVLNESGSSYVGETFTVRNVQIIDLTAMGLDITDPSEFTSLFSLPYYDFNQGSLLSFNGNGIKTTGKNLLQRLTTNDTTTNGITFTMLEDGVKVNGTATADAYANYSYANASIYQDAKPLIGKELRIGIYPENSGVSFTPTYFLADGSYKSLATTSDSHVTFTVPSEAVGFRITLRVYRGSTINNLVVKLMMSFSDVGDTTYVPYTESVLSLPISTYFPTGMKSAGSVYDELTPTKAITRIGVVDLGTLNWSYNEQYKCFIPYPVLTDIADLTTTSVPNFESIYKAVSWSVGATDVTQDMIVCYLSSAHQLRVRNKNFTDPTAFKTAMNGVYLYYELATPIETSFTTASLVTENAEIPLSNEDGVLVGKCTEQLSAEPGFHDAKIKLSDGDGECYSNKIQLHVERSPQ